MQNQLDEMKIALVESGGKLTASEKLLVAGKTFVTPQTVENYITKGKNIQYHTAKAMLKEIEKIVKDR